MLFGCVVAGCDGGAGGGDAVSKEIIGTCPVCEKPGSKKFGAAAGPVARLGVFCCSQECYDQYLADPVRFSKVAVDKKFPGAKGKRRLRR